MTTTVILEEKQIRKNQNLTTLKFLLDETWRKFKRTNVTSNLLFAGIIIITFLLISMIDNLAKKNEVQKGNLLINTKFENNLKDEPEENKKEEIKIETQEEVKTKSSETIYLMVNINTATSQMLQSLNGIGESYAEKIIEYRNSNGPFKTIDEIKNVKGIGDAKFNKIKKYIEV